jgi:peptidoglycan/xylan/chitin deacetylase (PgdA/CDA1 family)
VALLAPPHFRIRVIIFFRFTHNLRSMSAKIWVRNSAARLLYLTGLTAPEVGIRGRLTIVTFHRVLPEAERKSYPYPGLVVTPRELDMLLAYFTEQFECGTLATQHERSLRDEESARPLLALTFDDAPYDNYENARPVLAKHGVKASFFVPVIAVERQELLWHDRLGFAVLALLEQGDRGRERLMRNLAAARLAGRGPRSLTENIVQESKGLAPDVRLHLVDELEDASGATRTPAYARLMTFDEIAVLAADGHEIGSHSMTHCMMPECEDHVLNYELLESRRVLQVHVAQAIETFCYPNGNCDARTAHAVANAGYRRAVTTKWGQNGPQADRFQLRRYDMDARRMRDSSGNIAPALVAFRMSGFFAVWGSAG